MTLVVSLSIRMVGGVTGRRNLLIHNALRGV